MLHLLLYTDDLDSLGLGPHCYLCVLGFKRADAWGFRVEWPGMETEYNSHRTVRLCSYCLAAPRLGLPPMRLAVIMRVLKSWLADRLQSGGRLQPR